MELFKKWLEGQGQQGGIDTPSTRDGVPLSILGANHGNSKGAFVTGGDEPPTPNDESGDDETRWKKDMGNKKRKQEYLKLRIHPKPTLPKTSYTSTSYSKSSSSSSSSSS